MMKNHRWQTRCCRLSRKTLVLWLIFGVWLSSAAATSGRQSFPDLFDTQFQRHAARRLPWHWHWLKAQCWQESRLKHRAVSPVGAKGLCQFMPRTWRECTDALQINASPFNAEASIACAAWYDAKLRRTWRFKRSEESRRELVFASYNAGSGNVIAAQRACRGALDWQVIKECMPGITGHHSEETIDYVDRIGRWYQELTN